MYKGAFAVVSCCCGIFAAETFSVSAAIWAAGFVITAAAAVFSRRHKYVMQIMVIACFFCIGGGRLAVADAVYDALPHYLGGADIYLQGTVAERGRTYASDKGEMTRYVVSVDAFAYADETVLRPGSGSVYLTVPAQPVWQPSSRIAYQGKVNPIRYYRNRGAYDAVRRDKEKGIFLKSYNDRTGSVTLLKPPGGIFYRLGQIREILTERFQLVLHKDNAYILSSLLFGGHYDDLPPELVESFSATGLIHILSVSGSHIVLLIAVIQCIGRAVGAGKKSSFAAAAVFIIVYGALAEFTAPVVRASVMGLISAYSAVARREYVGIQALAIAVFFMLMNSPYILYDVSFRLSCGASAGIILFRQRLRPCLAMLPPVAADSLAVCICAQLLLVPLLFAYFFSFPVYSFAANILVAPVLEMIIVLGAAASICSYIAEPLMYIALFIIEPLMALAVKGNYFLASLPYSRHWSGAMPFPIAAAWYLAVFSVFFLPPMRRFLLGLAAVLCIGTAYWAYFYKNDVVVYIFDMGADTATCAVYDENSAYLWYNKSPWTSSEQALYVLTPAMRYEGIFRLSGYTVSGKDDGALADLIASQFVTDGSIRAAEKTAGSYVIAQGKIPYYLYEEIPAAFSPGYACVEAHSSGGTAFPAGIAALILHKGNPFDAGYAEWTEYAELYGIPCFSPERDGQITGKYRNGTWTFFTYGGI